jgi:hypothetical protein
MGEFYWGNLFESGYLEDRERDGRRTFRWVLGREIVRWEMGELDQDRVQWWFWYYQC